MKAFLLIRVLPSLAINTHYLLTYSFNMYLLSTYYVLPIVLGEPIQQNSLPLRNLHSNAGRQTINKPVKYTSEGNKRYEEKKRQEIGKVGVAIIARPVR